MNKFLSVLAIGLIAGGLSVSANAADPTKPATTPVASTATTAKVAENKAVSNNVSAKKDIGLKASVKKLFSPSSKKTDQKLK